MCPVDHCALRQVLATSVSNRSPAGDASTLSGLRHDLSVGLSSLSKVQSAASSAGLSKLVEKTGALPPLR